MDNFQIFSSYANATCIFIGIENSTVRIKNFLIENINFAYSGEKYMMLANKVDLAVLENITIRNSVLGTTEIFEALQYTRLVIHNLTISDNTCSQLVQPR